MPFGGGRRKEPKPLDQRTIDELRTGIVVFSCLGLGFLASVLLALYLLLFRFRFIWIFFLAAFSLSAIVIWLEVIAIGKELRRRKKSGKKSDPS
jgi:hypothetical protein